MSILNFCAGNPWNLQRIDEVFTRGKFSGILMFHTIIIPMKLPSIFSLASGALALLLGAWLLIASNGNTSKQAQLLSLQEEVQAKTSIVQKQQRDLQIQQQAIESGAQLAQQTGPSVLRDLATLQVENKNERIAELLQKYGLEVKLNPESQPATP